MLPLAHHCTLFLSFLLSQAHFKVPTRRCRLMASCPGKVFSQNLKFVARDSELRPKAL